MISTYAINTIEIIETAIRENISVSESCTLIGKNKNYVNDFFRRCPKMVSKSEFNHIKNLYEKYKISYSENSKQENTSSKPSKENLSQNNNTNASKRYQLKTNASSYDLNNTDFMLDVDTDEINKNSKLYKKDEFDLNNISFSSEEENTDLLYDPFSDKNYDEKRSYGESVRNNNGRITHYKYKIVIKGEPELNGEFTREEMDRVYRLYSNIEGAGLSIRTVSREFKNLTFRDFKRIIRVFNITKSSVPVAPHIIEENSTDEVANLILRNKENNILKALENDRSRFFERSLVGAYKTISDLKSNEVWIEDVVKKYIDKPETPSTNKRIKLQKDKKQNKTIKSPCTIAVFSDIHYGKKYENTVFGRGSNKEILHDRVMQIASHIIEDYKQRNPEKIILICGGDVLESIQSSGMHDAHLMEMDLFQEEQIFFACDSLKEMIKKIKENVNCNIEFHLQFGNHDRVSEMRQQDLNRTAGKIVGNILKRELEDEKIKIFLPKNNLIRIVTGNLCVFSQHGDDSLCKKKVSELSNLFGESGKYFVSLISHWHKFKTEEGSNCVSLTMPSVCSSDRFILESIGSNTLPGFIIGCESSYGIGFDYKKITLY